MQRKQYTSHSEQREKGTTISKRRIATERGGGRDKDRKREEHRKRGTERKSGAGKEFHDMGVREGTDAVVAN